MRAYSAMLPSSDLTPGCACGSALSCPNRQEQKAAARDQTDCCCFSLSGWCFMLLSRNAAVMVSAVAYAPQPQTACQRSAGSKTDRPKARCHEAAARHTTNIDGHAQQ